MTIGSVPKPDQYNGDGSTAVFTINFKFIKKSHVRVILTDPVGAETLWVEGTQYTLSDPGQETGALTVKTSPADYTPQAGETLTIKLDVPYLQEKQFPEAGPFPTAQVEEGFDLLTQIGAQLLETTDRTLRAPESETSTVLSLPPVASRKGKTLAFDEAGKPTPGVSIAALTATKYLDSFLGDGSTAAFTLAAAPASADAAAVYLDGVRQKATADYTVTGSTLTFTTAPANGLVILAAVDETFAGVPTDGSVTAVKIAAEAVGLSKLEKQTQGQIIVFGVGGAAAALGPGNADDVLFFTGAGQTPVVGQIPIPMSKAPPEIQNNATDANNDIDFLAGKCRDDADTANLVLAATLTKQLDAAWVAGSGAGGLFSGTKAASTEYHCHLIRKDSDSTIDAGFDTTRTAANIPAGYTAFRRLGSVFTDGAGNLRGFNQIGDWFVFSVEIDDVTSQVISGDTNLALTVPSGDYVEVEIRMQVFTEEILVSPAGAGLGSTGSLSPGSDGHIRTISNTAAEIRVTKLGVGNATLSIETVSYKDRRGRDS